MSRTRSRSRSRTCRYERDESGWWIARVHGVEGVHSNGRTIAEARRRVREALGLAIGDKEAEAAEFEDKIALPAKIQARLGEYHKRRKAAEEAQATAIDLSREVVRQLTQKLGMSVRDVGELLGLSYQRVQQLKR